MTLDLKAFHNTTWLVEPNQLRQLFVRLARFPACYGAREIAQARREAITEAQESGRKAVRGVKGKVGVIPIYGPVEQRMSSALMKADGTAAETVSVALDVLLDDASVESIVLDVDSPGGSIYGIEELSDKIFNARGRKPIYAIANSMAASAAYWIASAANVMAVTPGGDVGSVGVYALHVDESAALEAEGVKVTAITAGKYKAEFAPWNPLSDDAKAYAQQSVDYTYSKFLNALKRNRGVSLNEVRANFGQGRLVNPEEALEAKMVDRIMTFEALMDKLTQGRYVSGQKAASVELLRLRHEQRKREAMAV